MIILNSKYRSSKNLLIIAFLLLIIIPTMTLGFISFNYSKSIMQKKITEKTTVVLEQSSSYLEEQASKAENMIRSISKNKAIINMLATADFDNHDYELRTQFTNMDKALTDLIATYNLPVLDILIIHETGIYNLYDRIYLERSRIEKSDWYQMAISSYGKINWMGLQKGEGILKEGALEFDVSKALINPEDFKRVGVLFISIRPEYFRQFYSNKANDETVSVMDASGKILISTKPDEIGTHVKLQSFANSYEIDSERGRELVIQSAPNKYGWIVIKSIPIKSLTGEITNIKNFTIIVISVCLLLFAGCLYLIYRGISRPLEHMVNLLNDIETSGSDINLRKFPLYELLKISGSVVSLVEKNKSAQKKTAEMKLGKLQAQVNPHFLYNTLNSINHLALLNGQEKISQISISLVKFLKSSIGREGDFITIEKELENLQHYLLIQNFLYHDKIKVVFEIDETILQVVTPNFILQPLVENCIYHGINPNAGDGVITIRCYPRGNVIVMVVEDNGTGMDKTEIDDLFQDLGNQKVLHMGIRGTHEKIQLIYGNAYGLKIESKYNEGTKVTVTMPLK